MTTPELDRLTRTVTALDAWADLVASCRGGYVPTLRKHGQQLALGLELQDLSLRVFWTRG